MHVTYVPPFVQKRWGTNSVSSSYFIHKRTCEVGWDASERNLNLNFLIASSTVFLEVFIHHNRKLIQFAAQYYKDKIWTKKD